MGGVTLGGGREFWFGLGLCFMGAFSWGVVCAQEALQVCGSEHNLARKWARYNGSNPGSWYTGAIPLV